MRKQPFLLTRNADKKTFVALANHITEEVINRKEVYLLQF